MDWLMVFCANLTIPLMMAWKRSSGDLGTAAAVVSGLVALAIVNLVVIVSIRARNNRRGQNTSRALIFGAIVLAVASATVMALAVSSIPTHNEYVDLAFSNVPLSKIHPERKALVVELIRSKAANSREYDAVRAGMKPLSPELYSSESFASKEVNTGTMEQLRKATDADFAYRAKQQEAEKEFERKMSAVDPQYLRAFVGHSEEATDAATSSLEQQWLTSARELYEYAAAHQREIGVQNGNLKFANTAVEIEFNRRQEFSKMLYAKLLERVQGALRNKQQQRARIVMPTGPLTTSP
jgi:uncharacterized protein (DUF305 family)